MKRYIAMMLFATACGGVAEEFAEEELGQVSEGLSVKPSSEFTYGVSSSPSMQKCTVALGAGAGFSCIVPSRTTVRYKLSGFDEFDDQSEGEMSWRAMIRRAYTAGQLAGPFTFVEQDTSQTWVTFARGNCPGDPYGNHMNAFVCWQPGTTQLLTESLAGTYRKTTGNVTVILDIDAMNLRAPHSFTPPNRYDEAFHQLLEHAGHLGAMLPLGMGTTDVYQAHPYAWSSRNVERPGLTAADRYDFQNYTAKERCIMQSFSSMSQTTFTLLPGTCTD